MIEDNILYKLINNKYHFCYYSIDDPVEEGGSSDYNPYGLAYCQGKVGEFPEYEVDIDKDIEIIRGY